MSIGQYLCWLIDNPDGFSFEQWTINDITKYYIIDCYDHVVFKFRISNDVIIDDRTNLKVASYYDIDWNKLNKLCGK